MGWALYLLISVFFIIAASTGTARGTAREWQWKMQQQEKHYQGQVQYWQMRWMDADLENHNLRVECVRLTFANHDLHAKLAEPTPTVEKAEESA